MAAELVKSADCVGEDTAFKWDKANFPSFKDAFLISPTFLTNQVKIDIWIKEITYEM